MIKAILFDLFETLITESRLQPTRASRLGETLGCEPEAFRVAWKARRPRIVLGQLSFAEALTEISTSLAGIVDPAAIERACEQRIREKAAAYAQIDDEVAALVADLRGCGLGLAVISNCFKEDVLEWSTCPLARGFQSTLFSFTEGVAKPDPDIYLRATRRLGVEPAAAVFIGDGADNELAGAERAGVRAFRALWFTGDRLRDQWPEAPRFRVSNRQDVLKLVGAR
jgi:HAD superfamily hydrolase (TIGR01509 family)